jgi:hypothetical protein
MSKRIRLAMRVCQLGPSNVDRSCITPSNDEYEELEGIAINILDKIIFSEYKRRSMT